MINLAVINLKMCLKKLMKIIIAMLVFAMIIKFGKILYQTCRKIDLGSLQKNSNIGIVRQNMAISQYFEKEKNKNESELKKILVAQLAVFSGSEEEIMEKENQEEVLEFEEVEEVAEKVEQTQQPPPVEEAKPESETQTQTNLQTAVIETNNKKDVYTDVYQTVQIKNESQYSLTEEMVKPDVSYSDKQNMIIYHTHTCESYTPTENSQYVATGNYRTTDLQNSVVRVGEELTNYLAGKGYTVIHDKTYHDYPAYTGSYTRSLSTITNLLSVYQGVDAVFDIHRDALRKQ